MHTARPLAATESSAPRRRAARPSDAVPLPRGMGRHAARQARLNADAHRCTQMNTDAPGGAAAARFTGCGLRYDDKAPHASRRRIRVHLCSSALSLACFATNRFGATGSVGTAAARDDLPGQSYRGTMRLQASRATSHGRARPRLIGPLGPSVFIGGCIILLCPAFGQPSSQSERIGMAGPPRGGPVRCLISPRARIRRARSFRAARHRRRSTAAATANVAAGDERRDASAIGGDAEAAGRRRATASGGRRVRSAERRPAWCRA